jgi:hypothetical protein
LEPARIQELAHNDWLETGVAHQSRSNRQRLAIVTGKSEWQALDLPLLLLRQ